MSGLQVEPCAVAVCLFDVTEQSHSSEHPVLWYLSGAHDDAGDVGEVGAAGLLVDGADVELGILGGGGVDGKHVHHRQGREEHFGGGLDQTAVSAVPTGTIKEQAIHVDTLLW